MKIKEEHIWLNRDQIIEKFYNSKQLELKMDAILFRYGVPRVYNLLEDCRSATFVELCRMKPEKIEELYNGVMKKTFEGFIIEMFKNVSIRTSNNNPKGSVVSHLLHASSLNTNAAFSPTESTTDADDSTYTWIAADKEADEYSTNAVFNHILSKLTDEETETLNLLVDKKKTPGRYKREVKQKVDKLKEEIKQYVLEYDNSYLMKNKEKQEFRNDGE